MRRPRRRRMMSLGTSNCDLKMKYYLYFLFNFVNQYGSNRWEMDFFLLDTREELFVSVFLLRLMGV